MQGLCCAWHPQQTLVGFFLHNLLLTQNEAFGLAGVTGGEGGEEEESGKVVCVCACVPSSVPMICLADNSLSPVKAEMVVLFHIYSVASAMMKSMEPSLDER